MSNASGERWPAENEARSGIISMHGGLSVPLACEANDVVWQALSLSLVMDPTH
jgi:hypothetical protein